VIAFDRIEIDDAVAVEETEVGRLLELVAQPLEMRSHVTDEDAQLAGFHQE
jgi:hypothetical protein